MSADTIEIPEEGGGEDENARAVLHEANKIVSDERESVAIESVFGTAMKVAAHLKAFRSVLVQNVNELGAENGQFSEEWADEACRTIFHKFFRPYDAIDEEELMDRMHDHFERYHDES